LYRGIVSIDTVAQNGGEGFVAGETYRAISTGSAGTIINVTVSTVGASGNITSLVIDNASCTSTNYSVGDTLTVIWQPKGAQTSTTAHVDAVDYIQIDELQNTDWDYGCPISPIGTRFGKDPNDSGVPVSYRPSYSYRQKDLIDLNCNECDYQAAAPGASLYIGYDLTSLDVIMESGKFVEYKNVPAGSFLPIAVLTVCAAQAAGPTPPTSEELKNLILCLF